MLTSKSPWKVGREWQECGHPSRECLSQVANEQEPGQPHIWQGPPPTLVSHFALTGPLTTSPDHAFGREKKEAPCGLSTL